MTREPKSLTQQDIVNALSKFEVLRGGGVMVHSSLRSFGHVLGGAETVCRALMELVTPQGTLVLPSFNHEAPFKEGGPGYYNPLQTPTINGAIPDAFWRMPGVRRTLNPTHPIAAWGAKAEEYTRDHHRQLTVGRGSPLGRLWQDHGYVLLLGVGFGANTFHHTVETSLRSPCLGYRGDAYPVHLPDGRVVMGRTFSWREKACPITDHHRYDRVLFERGLVRQVQVGPSTASLASMADIYAVISQALTEGLDGFPPCSACPIRPRRANISDPSDWDWEKEQPLPDSIAWTY